jgi:iron complex outermembrane receptor protein
MFHKLFNGAGVGAGPFRDGAFVALVLSYGLAVAGEPMGAATYRIDQPSQPLAESLRAIARQTGVSVLFDPSRVGDRMSRAVSGQLTAGEAITQALEGSGLVLHVMGDGSIVIRSAGAPGAAPASAPREAAPAGSSGRADGSGDAAAVALANASPATLGGVGAGAVSALAGGAETSLARVEVTGSRLKRIDADGPAPVNVYTRTDIDRSGQPSLERFLSTLNEASVGPGEGAYGQTTGQGAVQLRGLPLGSTLVLINGRRLQAVGSSSGNFFNLGLIPMAAVERVEIVPVGSSAVYGGDALAGVVNVILKKSIEGVALEARLASAKGTGDRGLSLGTGGSSAAGSFLLLGSYNRTTPLTMAERDFFADADYRRYGGVDARTRACTPGTVSSTTGANLPGLNAPFAAIPANTPGQPLTTAGFAATAGQAHLCNAMANGHGMALVHGTETFALHAAGERRFNSAWAAFGELTFTRDRLRAEQLGLQLNNVLVPASNLYNPFGVPVRVTARLGLDNGVEALARDTDFTRALAGVRGDLGGGWDFETSVSTTRDDGGSRLMNTSSNAAARTAALGASTAAAALNPFASGVAASDEVLKSIWRDSIRDSHGRKDQLSGFVRGTVLELPTGSVDLIAGAEAGRDRYHAATVGSFDITGSRSNRAVYGELRVPVWRTRSDAAPARELAAVTVAGRRDSYSDFGSAGTYQIGAELRPVKTFLLRASTATSFKPPTLLQTNVDETSFSTDAYGLVDPTRANAPIVGGEVLRATNTDLHPESGRAYSFGAVWEPESAAGTRLGVTAWRVKINGLISLLWPQLALDNEALFPGFVTRAPSVGGVPGPVTRVLYSEVNFGRVDTAGADFEIAHAWKSAGTKWTLSASATRTTRYDVTLAPGAPVEHRLARRAVDYWAPKWKGRLFAGLDQGAWSVGMTSRYLGAYQEALPSQRRLGKYWVHDLAATLNLKRLGLGLTAVKEASLSLAIANIADRQPEFVETSPYYDVTQADWRGRYASLRLSLNW